MISIYSSSVRQGTDEGVNKYRLALSTLSTLLRQHHQNQDLRELLRTFVLSVAGQFRIPSVFMSLVDAPSELPGQLTFFGVGQFRKCQSAVDECKDAILRKLGDSRDVISDNDWEDEADEQTQRVLQKVGVHLIIPFRHESRTVGLLGLGSRPPDGRYSAEEIEVLKTYSVTVAPFIGDLFLLFTLADVNRRHTNILNATKQAVLVFDRSGCLVSLNDAARQMLLGDQSDASSTSSLIGMSQRLLFPPKSFPHWHRLIADVTATNRPETDGIIKSEVSGRIYKASVTLLDDRDPNKSDLVVVMDDITDLKSREEQMLSLQIAAEKGYMTSSVAHEIGNFVSVILGGAELALQMVKNGNAERAMKDLELVIDKSARLERYTHGLVNRHRLDPSWSQEDVNKLIIELKSFVEMQHRFDGIAIELSLDPAIPLIRLDPDQISQVLINLLNNAADAIREGNHATPGCIQINTGMEQDMIRITLKDNGAGMPVNVQEKLFAEQFTTKDDGHGYGLTLCEKVIANHEGTITVESTPGKGTTFTIAMPIRSAEL